MGIADAVEITSHHMVRVSGKKTRQIDLNQGAPGNCGWGSVSAASPICSDFQTFCPDWLHFGHFLCFGGIAASQLSLRIFPIYF